MLKTAWKLKDKAKINPNSNDLRSDIKKRAGQPGTITMEIWPGTKHDESGRERPQWYLSKFDSKENRVLQDIEVDKPGPAVYFLQFGESGYGEWVTAEELVTMDHPFDPVTQGNVGLNLTRTSKEYPKPVMASALGFLSAIQADILRLRLNARQEVLT